MRYLVILLLSCALLPPAQAISSGWQSASHLQAELVSEYQQVSPGQTVRLALHFIADEHWHTYWKNPGDSGLATRLHWQLPAGVSAADIQWPAPEAIALPPLVNYGFSGPTMLLSDIQIPADYAADTLPVALQADWLVCEDICIPAQAQFQLILPVAKTSVVADTYAALFAQAGQQLPQALQVQGQFDVSNGMFSARIILPSAMQVSRFFVAATELVDHAAAQHINLQGNELLLRQPVNTYYAGAPQRLELVLQGTAGAYSVMLAQSTSAAAELLLTQGQQNDTALWLILLLAATGGLLLNLMPCVFPVLSLKALSIAANSQQHSRQRRDALLYSAGVVLSFVALALLLIVLRELGAAVGWGFQLQSPYLVALLVYLLFALGLSLSGVVQFGLGLMQTGQGLTAGKSSRAAFFTGVLAVVVASPCTAPLMAPALGFALTQNALVAMLVFFVLGLGMALPFLLLACVPGFARRLPKPGAWMGAFKQWLAFPLYLTAVWLVWVYGRQSGVNAQALLLIGVVCIAAACWLWGRRQLAQTGISSTIIAAVLLIFALLLPLMLSSPSTQQAADSRGQHWQKWSAATLQQLRQRGKPVLVNMTADWCITCLVNERVALNTDSSKAALALFDVTYLKGDWTLRDAAITEYLRLYQRDGVPLYVLYWPGQPPQVLPQILMPDTLAQTLQHLSRQP
jgi:thiol:disulfide interchange protein